MRAGAVKKLIAALPLLLILTLSGCLNQSMEELFTLPKPSEQYLELQNAIEEVLSTGVVYSAPAGGNYRQSVQLWDFDGDGVNEAVAFFSGSGDNPLKLYIFKSSGEGYAPALILEGEGTGFASVDYTDLNGDGWLEIIISRRISAELRMLRVYSIRDFQLTPLVTADYSEYAVADLNGDSVNELFIFRHNAAELTGTVEMLAFGKDGGSTSATESLSSGMEGISRITKGLLQRGVTALFVDGAWQDGVITDILIADGDSLVNLTRAAESGASLSTVRAQSVYSRDIDDDGLIEIPITQDLPGAGETVYRVIDWKNYDSQGRETVKLTAYHNWSDGWYLALPPEWANRLTLRRDDSVAGQRAVVFSVLNDGGEPVEALVIYALSGENRGDMAEQDGRAPLRREDEVIYACKLMPGAGAIDLAYVKSNFKLIYSEWVTGGGPGV